MNSMLFRVHVTVVLTVRERMSCQDPGALESRDDDWSDSLSYSFGINAEDAAAATGLADRAAEHALDRDGNYIGGVRAQFQVTRASAAEFDGYDEHLLQPFTQPGIFYVTGTTSHGMPHAMIKSSLDELAELRQSIARHGLPPPSFRHPKPPPAKPPKRTRIVCPGCHRWAEFDGRGVVYSQCVGVDPASRESRIGREVGRALGTFIESHMPCLPYARQHAFVFLYEEDPRYRNLDPDREEPGAG